MTLSDEGEIYHVTLIAHEQETVRDYRAYEVLYLWVQTAVQKLIYSLMEANNYWAHQLLAKTGNRALYKIDTVGDYWPHFDE